MPRYLKNAGILIKFVTHILVIVLSSFWNKFLNNAFLDENLSLLEKEPNVLLERLLWESFISHLLSPTISVYKFMKIIILSVLCNSI